MGIPQWGTSKSGESGFHPSCAALAACNLVALLWDGLPGSVSVILMEGGLLLARGYLKLHGPSLVICVLNMAEATIEQWMTCYFSGLA